MTEHACNGPARMRIIICMALVLFGVGGLSTVSAQDEPRKFSYGITGSAHPVETENPGYYFSRPEVQALASDMIPGPISLMEVERRMSTVDGVTAEDLFRTGLLRKEGDRAFLNFVLNTKEDVAKIRAAMEEPLKALTAAYFEQSLQIAELLDSYPNKTVSKGAIAFILVGAFSLDWDGLYLTAEKGYRARPPERLGHFFRAEEQTDDHNMREVYKGSHNYPAGRYQFTVPFDSTFTSFGDHYRRGRAAFPDILWQPTDWYKEEEQSVVKALQPFSSEKPALDTGFISEQTAVAIADILFALRKSPADFKSLRKVTGVDTQHLSHILNLLEEIQYIDKLSNGQHVLLVPVLDYDDRPMVDAVLALSWEIMEAWLAEHYDVIKVALADTTTMRHGVSYEEYFSNIWHHIFGLQNKEMTHAGLFAHPYGIDKKYKAFYPALWRSEVYDYCGKKISPCEQ